MPTQVFMLLQSPLSSLSYFLGYQYTNYAEMQGTKNYSSLRKGEPMNFLFCEKR